MGACRLEVRLIPCAQNTVRDVTDQTNQVHGPTPEPTNPVKAARYCNIRGRPVEQRWLARFWIY